MRQKFRLFALKRLFSFWIWVKTNFFDFSEKFDFFRSLVACQNLPKMGKIVKNKFFSSIKKTLVLLKKTVKNRRFNPWKCAASGCAWNHPEWIWSVFMHFYEGAHVVRMVFWPLLTPFWPFWAIFDHIGGYVGPFLGHFGIKIGPFWGDFGMTLDPFSVDPGSLWVT